MFLMFIKRYFILSIVLFYVARNGCINKSSRSLYESTSSSEDDNDLDGVFIAQIMKEYEEFFFLSKTPQKNIYVKWCTICKRYTRLSSSNML